MGAGSGNGIVKPENPALVVVSDLSLRSEPWRFDLRGPWQCGEGRKGAMDYTSSRPLGEISSGRKTRRI
jgi:hypothetical protein